MTAPAGLTSSQQTAPIVSFAGDDRPAPRRRFDHAAAIKMLETGEANFKEVGDKFGVSRERIRQIARQHGVTSARSREVVHQNDLAVIDVLSRLEDISAAAVALGISETEIRTIAKRTGLDIDSFTSKRKAAYERRKKIVVEGQLRSLKWEQMAKDITLLENRTMISQSLYNWATYHGLVKRQRKLRCDSRNYIPPAFVNHEPGQRLLDPPHINAASRHDQQFIYAVVAAKKTQTARETGFQFGLSRNAVIGIWGRYARRLQVPA